MRQQSIGAGKGVAWLVPHAISHPNPENDMMLRRTNGDRTVVRYDGGGEDVLLFDGPPDGG